MPLATGAVHPAATARARPARNSLNWRVWVLFETNNGNLNCLFVVSHYIVFGVAMHSVKSAQGSGL